MKSTEIFPETYQDALEMGYEPGETSRCNGYVKRDTPENEYEVKIAGGRRKGQLYVEIPSGDTPQIVVRQYLKKRSDSQ